jgi:hypothetical protein
MENKLAQYVHERTSLNIDQIMDVIYSIGNILGSIFNTLIIGVFIFLGFVVLAVIIYITRSDNNNNNNNNTHPPQIYITCPQLDYQQILPALKYQQTETHTPSLNSQQKSNQYQSYYNSLNNNNVLPYNNY